MTAFALGGAGRTGSKKLRDAKHAADTFRDAMGSYRRAKNEDEKNQAREDARQARNKLEQAVKALEGSGEYDTAKHYLDSINNVWDNSTNDIIVANQQQIDIVSNLHLT